jgi:hypothetical protein
VVFFVFLLESGIVQKSVVFFFLIFFLLALSKK